jgi:hypothetical protein
LLFLADHFDTNAILDHAYLRAAAHAELASAFEDTKRLLGQHREVLKKVAGLLQSKGRIDGLEVAEIIEASLTGNVQQTFGS